MHEDDEKLEFICDNITGVLFIYLIRRKTVQCAYNINVKTNLYGLQIMQKNYVTIVPRL